MKICVPRFALFVVLVVGTIPGLRAQPATPRLLDLGATSCIPCKLMAPILEELEREYAGRANVVFVHVPENPVLGARYGIRSIPAMYLIDHEGVCISDRARGSALERAVKDAGVSLPDIDHVLLVGGSTRMPAVAALVEELGGQVELDESTGHVTGIDIPESEASNDDLQQFSTLPKLERLLYHNSL